MANLRIKAIQYNTDDLYPILDTLGNGFNIIYSNLKSNIKLNGIKLTTRKFDKMLYNKEDNIIILLMRDGVISKDDIIEYLEIYDKPYAEVTFEENIYDDYKNDNNIPEIIFINNKKALCEELTKHWCQGNYNCIYFNKLKASYNFGYMSKFGERFSIDKKSFKGVIRFKNKLMLLSDEDNLTEENIKNILNTYQINFVINEEDKFDLSDKESEDKVKTLKLQRFEYFK